MLFNSRHFGLFLPPVFMVYWLLPDKFRWLVILASSYYFYMSWNVKYIVLILFTTVISYFAAILIERFNDNKTLKKFILVMTLLSCLGVLFMFKYFNFFSRSFIKLMSLFAIELHPVTLRFLLPVGISFYTFQTLSYVIDVYKSKIRAERHFGYYAAFISFFPQLVAGPIERTNNLLTQIKAHHEFNYVQAAYGLKLMAWGFFKKLIIADCVAVYSDKVFNDVYNYKGFALIIAAFFFTIQIYCDFSGYSDIARGCAKLFGIELMQNFKSPYFSSSIKEFWSRWHISLSTWFRDYVYIPLGGSKVSRSRHYINLMITFIISGLWHGANLTFIIWGAFHGLAQVLEKILVHDPESNNNHALRVFMTFIFCMFSWIFFRANNYKDALYIFTNLFSGITNIKAYFITNGYGCLMIHNFIRLKILFTLLVLAVWDYLSLKHDVIKSLTSHENFIARYSFYFGIITLLILLNSSGSTQFVYFQF